MADDDLDDFFAKKDKSKKKSKIYTATDIPSKPHADSADETKKTKKKRLKTKEKKSALTSSGSAASNNKEGTSEREQDEWKEYEAETEADYSGLRVQNLQITNRDQEEEDRDEEDYGSDEDGERREKKDAPQGPWNKVPSTHSEEKSMERPKPDPVQVPEPEHEQQKGPTKYVPPAMRRAMMEGGSSSSPSRPAMRRSKKDAPNLRCEEEFPTLGQATVEPEKDDPFAGSFESVRGGGRMVDSSTKAVQLQLGNKFDALSMDS